MNCKYLTYLLVIVALAVGVLSLINQNMFAIAAITSRFFEIMLPVLGFAALIKYLFSCTSKGSCDNNKCN